ncbi:hypothetical protein HDU97_007138 [Phlyctochytrium planicorne]|nr:hypothetical protein HDU97_007138 [Phlyctochytrium planicorne]
MQHEDRTKIILTIGASILATYTLYRTTTYFYKRSKVRNLKRQLAKDIASSNFTVTYQHNHKPTNQPAPSTKDLEVKEELNREQLARNYAFLGDDGMQKIRGSFVIVVGLGGVGSHAAHMLLRSGIQRLRLIDFDQVSLSSLNRHAVATRADVGIPKATCLYNHFLEISPDTLLEPIVRLFDINAADELLEGNPDYVLDCIDNLQTKVDLIRYCKERNMRIISSMGAGAKSDASYIQIADISETFEDALARSTRKGLRLKGIDGGVPVVYSSEKPGTVKLLPLEEQKVEAAQEYGPLPNFRARILPVLGTLPAMFGMAMASYVITDLAGFPTSPLRVKQRTKVYERILKDLKQEEMKKRQAAELKRKKAGTEGGDVGDIDDAEEEEVMLHTRDVGYILDEVFKSRSIFSGSIDKDKITLSKWNLSQPYLTTNMVCMTKSEADKHMAGWIKKFGGVGVKVAVGDKEVREWLVETYGGEIVEKVEERLKEMEEAEKWRG